ncbi:MAG: NAD-dependent epimerase/dehydratase family protein [Verrucomicrobiota bacterium]
MPSPSFRVLIVGAGYVGRRLGELLREQDGLAPLLWVRGEDSAAELRTAGFHVQVGDAADTAAWALLGSARFDAIVLAASSGRSGADAYRRVFIEAPAQAAAHQPQARLVLVSSTSVYGQTDGGPVSEASPAEPTTPTGRVLRRAEELALHHRATVLRVAGIYGPGRSIYLRKLREGTATLDGDGSRRLNQIHRDDVAGALRHVLAEPATGGQIFNAADDTHPTQRELYAWLAERLKLELPPSRPAPTERKRGNTSKRVANAKLRATGWAPLYPDYRDGYAAVLEEET